jgi:hypothetical protein
MKNAGIFCILLFLSLSTFAQKKSKGKNKKEPVKTDYITVGDTTPTPDSATRFTGLIKYKMMSDDPADQDSMFIYFGENRLRFTLFTPGYKEGQIFETNMIANFSDSTLFVLDMRNKSYKIEKFGDRNKGTEFSLATNKKTGPVMKFVCTEWTGEMKTADQETYEAACLVSKNHSSLQIMDYNFLNIQPVIIGYRVVLGFRTKSSENENTYIVAYQIEPGDVNSFFDMTGYKAN